MNKIIGCIEDIKISIEDGKIFLYGYSIVKEYDMSNSNNVKKSLIISKGNKRFFIPVENVFRNDLSKKFGQKKFNYDYAGFSGYIDIGFIDDMSPLEIGTWKLSIYLCVDGFEIEQSIGYDSDLQNIDNDNYKIYFKKSKKLISINFENNIISIESKYEEKIDKYNGTIGINNEDNKGKNSSNSIKRRIGNFVFKSLYKIIKPLKIKKNRVTFLSDSRVDFSGNFEFIYKELLELGGYDIKYLLKPRINAPKTMKEKLKFIYYISTSKYILLDDYYPQIYKYEIKKDIEVIQLWHACGAFKTFGFSRMGKVGGPSSKSRNHKNYTKAIVSSESIKKNYAEAFGISEDKVIATGVPRTDIFFDEKYKNNKIKEIYEKYPILKNKKVVLFAPTFRGSGQKSAHYDFSKLDIDRLRNELGNDYIMIMKLHPFIKDSIKITEENRRFIIDLSNEREINDLLFVSDILITDYSSVCFEYSLLNRPMIFFTYDLEEYIESRDFYYPFESFVPGPIVRSTEEIIDVIKNNHFDFSEIEEFKNKFFSHLDGNSTKRVIDELIKID